MNLRGQNGQSLVEGILLSLLLLVPMIWALGVLSNLHRGALAATAAAREAGFEAARSESLHEADRAVASAVDQAFANHGLEPLDAEVEYSLAGLERGGSIELQVRYPVTVVQAPLLGRVAGPSIWVDASHIAIVDPYRSREDP